MADPIDTKPLRNDVAECVERARGLHIMPVMTVTAGLMLALLDALDAERARVAETVNENRALMAKLGDERQARQKAESKRNEVWSQFESEHDRVMQLDILCQNYEGALRRLSVDRDSAVARVVELQCIIDAIRDQSMKTSEACGGRSDSLPSHDVSSRPAEAPSRAGLPLGKTAKSAHTCILTATTVDGSVPPTCPACAALRGDDHG